MMSRESVIHQMDLHASQLMRLLETIAPKGYRVAVTVDKSESEYVVHYMNEKTSDEACVGGQDAGSVLMHVFMECLPLKPGI